MRLIVELDDEFYNHIQNDHEYFLEDGEELFSIVQNAAPIPDNATDELEATLDKIRAEIEQKIIKSPYMYFKEYERWHNDAILEVLDIIDKYRESEG